MTPAKSGDPGHVPVLFFMILAMGLRLAEVRHRPANQRSAARARNGEAGV